MTLHIIAAVTNDGGFGFQGKIPWNYPEDFKHFKEITKGHICVMGRRTYDDMLEMATGRGRKKINNILVGRDSYVISSTESEFRGAKHASSLSSVVDANPGRDIFVLGGERLFIEALASVHKVHLTVIDKYYECDRFFLIDYLSKRFNIAAGNKIQAADGTDLYMLEYTRI